MPKRQCHIYSYHSLSFFITMNTETSACPITIEVEDDRTGLSVTTLKRALADNLFYLQGKFPGIATKND